MLFVRAVRFA